MPLVSVSAREFNPSFFAKEISPPMLAAPERREQLEWTCNGINFIRLFLIIQIFIFTEDKIRYGKMKCKLILMGKFIL